MTLSKESIPFFAVLGHPNEGKSSVVSTLTEDDQIPVSQVPGETRVSGAYTVTIDGKPVITFTDTPGFQVPRQTLAWFRAHPGPDLVSRFIEAFRSDPFFADECELFSPVARGAGIIYVVDGSRPVREDDLAEMEILRLTGRPRMAVINAKKKDPDYTEAWKAEFRKHFNVIRVFNSNQADFFERIRMLESLKAIDQDWEEGLSAVILAFKGEWEKRSRLACAHMVYAMEMALAFSVSGKIGPDADPVTLEQTLTGRYQDRIRQMEARMFQQIRRLFRHHLYDYPLPEYSVLHHDLFSGKTWEVLGLSRGQLAAAGALVGGSVGVVADTATAGLTFGLFTAIGSALGAGSALLGLQKLSARKRIGGDYLRVGPNQNIQFLYVLLDRALLYFIHIIQRAHGRRDMDPEMNDSGKQGVSVGLTPAQQRICAQFFRAAQGKGLVTHRKAGSRFALLVSELVEKAAGRSRTIG